MELTYDHDADIGGYVIAAIDLAAQDAAFVDCVKVLDRDVSAERLKHGRAKVYVCLKLDLEVQDYPSARATAQEVPMLLRRLLWRVDAEIPHCEPFRPVSDIAHRRAVESVSPSDATLDALGAEVAVMTPKGGA